MVHWFQTPSFYNFVKTRIQAHLKHVLDSFSNWYHKIILSSDPGNLISEIDLTTSNWNTGNVRRYFRKKFLKDAPLSARIQPSSQLAELQSMWWKICWVCMTVFGHRMGTLRQFRIWKQCRKPLTWIIRGSSCKI